MPHNSDNAYKIQYSREIGIYTKFSICQLFYDKINRIHVVLYGYAKGCDA